VSGWERSEFGKGQAIRREPDGVLWGGSEPRRRRLRDAALSCRAAARAPLGARRRRTADEAQRCTRSRRPARGQPDGRRVILRRCASPLD